ncbi:MAG: hypothetical protein WCX31_20265 [Salinivirgaceae bacterium]
MKKLIFYLFIGTVFFAVSCTEKDPADDNTFSTKSVEENKQSIETSGIEMINEMQDMEQEPAIQANIAMVTFMETSDPFEGNSGLNKKVVLSRTIAFAPVFASANYSETGVEGMLKSIQVNPAVGDPETIQELYDLLVGVYSWNAATETWDYSDTGTIIKFEFPSTQDGTVNDATYTVSYTGYTGPNPIDDYTGDLPQNVTAELKVDDNTKMSFVVDIEYNTNGYPTSIESTLTIGEWVWYAMASNTNNAAFATEFSFKHATKILLRLTLDAAGNWSKENIEANTTYYKETWYEIGGYWYWEEVEVSKDEPYDYSNTDIHKVINSGNASFQAMNLKIVGSIDVLNFGNEMNRIDETYDWETQEEQIVAAQVVAINKYVSLSLRYADNNAIIALVEAFPVSEDYTYQEYWYDGTWHETQRTVTETDYWFDMRFVFADGSKVDAETYFGEGFEDVIDEFETYLEELENTYGKK